MTTALGRGVCMASPEPTRHPRLSLLQDNLASVLEDLLLWLLLILAAVFGWALALAHAWREIGDAWWAYRKRLNLTDNDSNNKEPP